MALSWLRVPWLTLLEVEEDWRTPSDDDDGSLGDLVHRYVENLSLPFSIQTANGASPYSEHCDGMLTNVDSKWFHAIHFRQTKVARPTTK